MLPQSTVKDWDGTGNGFQGKISHHGAGRPFKDGYMNKMDASSPDPVASAQQGNDVSLRGTDRQCRKCFMLCVLHAAPMIAAESWNQADIIAITAVFGGLRTAAGLVLALVVALYTRTC